MGYETRNPPQVAKYGIKIISLKLKKNLSEILLKEKKDGGRGGFVLYKQDVSFRASVKMKTFLYVIILHLLDYFSCSRSDIILHY